MHLIILIRYSDRGLTKHLGRQQYLDNVHRHREEEGNYPQNTYTAVISQQL